MAAEIHALMYNQLCNKPANLLDTYVQVSRVTHSPPTAGGAVARLCQPYPGSTLLKCRLGRLLPQEVGRTGWERGWQVGRGHRVGSPNERREDVPTQVAAQAPPSL